MDQESEVQEGSNDVALTVADVTHDFDFERHGDEAQLEFERVRQKYVEFAESVKSLLETCAEQDRVPIHSMESRAKSLESFNRKASKPSEDSPNRPRYYDPLTQITDLAGVRVITFFLSSVDSLDGIVRREFKIFERTDKSKLLEQEERLGYQSVHYIVGLHESRLSLPEYSRFRYLKAEIQVRTILQHAWAEIEHDLQYKAERALPAPIRRRFMTLAGMLEIADREFQGIQEQNDELRDAARSDVAAGRLSNVEITPDALRAYLDRRLGPDGRLSAFTYVYASQMLEDLGFENLQEVDEAIRSLDDDRISRVIHGSRQGQVTRFEDCLLVAMGDFFHRAPSLFSRTRSVVCVDSRTAQKVAYDGWPYLRRVSSG